MSVAFHDLKMCKQKVCEEKKEGYPRNCMKVGGGRGKGERKSRKHEEHYIFKRFWFVFNFPKIESISVSEQS